MIGVLGLIVRRVVLGLGFLGSFVVFIFSLGGSSCLVLKFRASRTEGVVLRWEVVLGRFFLSE